MERKCGYGLKYKSEAHCEKGNTQCCDDCDLQAKCDKSCDVGNCDDCDLCVTFKEEE